MVTYIYFVKRPNCEDEPFDFFDEAKEFALGCLTKKPTITQTEVCRNDFGECTDSVDLGTIWSWEDMMQDTVSEDDMVFSKNETFGISEDFDDFDDFDIGPQIDEFDSIDNSVDFEEAEPTTIGTSVNRFVIVGEKEDYTKQYYNQELDAWVDSSNDATLFDDRNHAIEVLYDLDKSAFYTTRVMIKLTPTTEGGSANSNNFRKPIPEGMTIEQLVEEMEENEDTVECTWCEELFDKSECRYEVGAGGPEDGLGWLCGRCEAAIKSRGETLTFKENNYWDFLDEDIEKPVDEDLEWHTYKITFTDKVNPETEHTTTFKTWQSDVEYAWRMSNANIPHTIVKNIELIEDTRRDPFDHHDPDYDEDEAADCIADQIDNAKDAAYDNSLDTLEEAADYRKHLVLCPECGADQALDTETGICINCGFSL